MEGANNTKITGVGDKKFIEQLAEEAERRAKENGKEILR